MTSTEPAPLTNEQISEILRLMKSADSVELKLTVPDAQRRTIMEALEIDPLDGQIRQVAFFDTPDLQLYQRGVVVRARRVQGGRNDSVVKLRPVIPDELPAELRASVNFGVEVDAMPGGFVCSGSFKAKSPDDLLKQVMAGQLAVAKLFTKEQRAFYTEHAPAGVGLADLSLLGPINLVKLKFAPTGFARRMVAELWFYPDGHNIVELSTKCAPNEAFQVATETKAFLAERGVDLGSEQQTKTRTALDYFSRKLQAKAAREAADNGVAAG